MLKCPCCGKVLTKEEFKISDMTVDFVEVEAYCANCEKTVLWSRICPDEWIDAD